MLEAWSLTLGAWSLWLLLVNACIDQLSWSLRPGPGRTLWLTRRLSFANGLALIIPRDSVKFWMFKYKHSSVYHILCFLPADPNKLDSRRIHYCCQGLDSFDSSSRLSTYWPSSWLVPGQSLVMRILQLSLLAPCAYGPWSMLHGSASSVFCWVLAHTLWRFSRDGPRPGRRLNHANETHQASCCWSVLPLLQPIAGELLPSGACIVRLVQQRKT